MNWRLSWRADPRALALADEHYNRQKPGTNQFVPPGRCLVLLTPECEALWTTSWPYPEFVKHRWPGAWVCSLFRNRDESPLLASDLITQAVAATRWRYGDPPSLGMVTFIDPSEVPGFFRRTADGTVLDWGYSYYKAGFEYDGWTEGGLLALRLRPEMMPQAEAPDAAQLRIAI